MDEFDPKEYASQAYYPTTVKEVVQFFRIAGYSNVSVVKVSGERTPPHKSWHLQACANGTHRDVVSKFAEDIKNSGLRTTSTTVGIASDANERAVYDKVVHRVCTACIPWDDIVPVTAESVVDNLLEDEDSVTAEPVSRKAEVKILPAVGLDHHHDVVLVSDQEPVYVGTIAPRASVWRVVRTAPNIGRKMRTELHWTMPTKEECALRMVEVMRQFWKPVIAGHAVAESADDLDPKAFVNREFGRLRTWRDLQKYPDDQVFACYDPTVAKDRGLKIPFYCWSAMWKGGGVVSVAFEGGTEKIDARLFDLGYGARNEQYDFVPVTSLKPVARVGTEATFESDDAVDPKEFVNDHFKYLYIVRRDESAWFNRGIVNSAKAPVVGVFRRRETAVNYASNMGGMVYRAADTSPVVKSWLIAGNRITESEATIDPKEYVNFTLSRGCTLQERAGRNGHTAEEPVLDVVGPNGKILGTVYAYAGGEWCGVKRDPSGDLDLGSDTGYTDSIERAAEYVIGLHDISRLESVADDIEAAASETDPNPSDAQKEAGNYSKGKIRLHGMEITIENAAGSKRSGPGKDGKRWEVEMSAHYGYITTVSGKTIGKTRDGDHVDCYIGEKPGAMIVYIVNQNDERGKFDEIKAMIGFEDKEAAVQAYKKGFSGDLGDKLFGSAVSVTLGDFKEWLLSDQIKKPFKKLVERIVDELVD